MDASINQIIEYIKLYIFEYTAEYKRFISPHPLGGGYPELPISPYISSEKLTCLVLKDGVIIIEQTSEPPYQWYIAGGPAIKIDYEPTKTPKEVNEILEREGISGKPIGIYRIVSKQQLPTDVWNGYLGKELEKIQLDIEPGRRIVFYKYELSLAEAVNILTFGGFGEILDIHLPNSSSSFWTPHIVRNFGFFTADLNNKAFYNYLEFIPHIDISAWDVRNISVRVKYDVRRDFSSILTEREQKESGGMLSFGASDQIEKFNNQLNNLWRSINGLEQLLIYQNNEIESVFHNYLNENSILIDVYGIAVSKPRFTYPEGEMSPVGKTYVEPDFIVVYPDRRYKLIEIERPSKSFATKAGHPRQDFNQAAFQIGEWVHYIKHHYNCIKMEFPGIASNYSTAVVMSRTRDSFAGENEFRDYIGLMKETSKVDEILTFDDLLERSKFAYTRLSSLGL